MYIDELDLIDYECMYAKNYMLATLAGYFEK